MGGETYQRTRSPENFGPLQKASGLLCGGFLYRNNRALTPERGGKRTARGGGGPKPFLGGVSFVRFPPPSFSNPPWRPLMIVLAVERGVKSSPKKAHKP